MFVRLPLPLLTVLCLLVFSFAEAQEDAVRDLLAEAPHVLETAGGTYVGIGNSVLKLGDDDGPAEWRTAVAGRVALLEEENGGLSVVAELPGGLSERLSIDADGRTAEPVRFGTDPEMFRALRLEAEVPDPARRLEADPTNPWLYVRLAEETSGEEAAGYLADALAQAETFYDLAGLAAVFAEAGEFELAETARQESLQDFVARGYDAQLLTDPDLHAAYGFPLPHLKRAMVIGDEEAAAFHAGWLQAFLAPGAPFVADGLEGYAGWLEERGDRQEAAAVREWLRPSGEELAASGVERLFLSLGRSGWYMFGSIVVVILALQVTLTFKYWEPQGLALRRAAETGGSDSFLQRFLAIRFFSTTEKIMLALLYGAGLCLLGLTAWAAPGGPLPAAAASGTLAGTEAVAALDSMELRGERGQFVLGYAAEQAGMTDRARLHYRAAPRFGPALNNLALLDDDHELLERAAAHAPALGTISWNLGREDNQPLFDRLAGLERPVPLAPQPADFFMARHGSWQQALTAFYTGPVTVFTMDVPWLPAHWLWYGILSVYVVLGALTLLWVLVPRPRLARNAPRPFPYQLLALLVPGSGQADEMWGLLLLVPWGIFGTDLVWRLADRPALLELETGTLILIVAILYAINVVAFIIEYISYRRRTALLFQRNPEAAIAYGRRIEPDSGLD